MYNSIHKTRDAIEMFVENNVRITMFPAGAGDCLLIEFLKEDYRILLDGGYTDTYHNYLRRRLIELSEQGKKINLLVITHIDADHIGGIQAFLKENGTAKEPAIIGVSEVWYNAFAHMNTEKAQSGDVPYTIKEILMGSIAAYNSTYSDGRHDISVAQGNTVAGLLRAGGYNWNTTWCGKAICVENGKFKKLTDKIHCTLLGPDEDTMKGLAEVWVTKLKSTVKRFVICEDGLYSEAFECDCIQSGETTEGATKQDIGYKTIEETEKHDWDKLVDTWSGQMDASVTNRSSIAFMLEYKDLRMLFPGDSPLQIFQETLPAKIDIVKLPHHGSEKNISKEFIQNTEVSYYLLSTEGKKHDHPSKSVIGAILCIAPGSPSLIKNYEISGLEDIGTLMRYEHG